MSISAVALTKVDFSNACEEVSICTGRGEMLCPNYGILVYAPHDLD